MVCVVPLVSFDDFRLRLSQEVDRLLRMAAEFHTFVGLFRILDVVDSHLGVVMASRKFGWWIS